MNKSLKRAIIVIIAVMSSVVFLLALNSKVGFLPRDVTLAVDNFCSRIIKKSESIDTSDYVPLSTLTSSALFDDMDLLVPNNTFIPTKEEVSLTYSGLYADTIVAASTNADIIVQAYGIDIIDETNLMAFRDQLVSGLSISRPDISFSAHHVIQKDNSEIPTIEFSTAYDDREIHSFIAIINVNGKLVTVAVNGEGTQSDVRVFFNTLINNMVLK